MSAEWASMSIASWGPSTLPDAKRAPAPFAIKKLTDNSDIDGSFATNRFEMFTQKYYKFQQEEVIGSKPATRTRTRNGPDLQLEVDDIEGARVTKVQGIYTTKRHVDPLAPEYKLPTFAVAEPAATKFSRDALDHSDISGSFSQPLYKPYTRDIIQVSDIDGTNTHWRSKHGYATIC
jgi:hypothetical protein